MQPNAVVEWKDIIGKQFPFSEMETVRVVIIHAKVGPAAEPPIRGLLLLILCEADFCVLAVK